MIPARAEGQEGEVKNLLQLRRTFARIQEDPEDKSSNSRRNVEAKLVSINLAEEPCGDSTQKSPNVNVLSNPERLHTRPISPLYVRSQQIWSFLALLVPFSPQDGLLVQAEQSKFLFL